LKKAHKNVSAIHGRPLFVGYSPTKKEGIALLAIVNETMQRKQILAEEIGRNKLDLDIRYTSIYDWDWNKECNAFEVAVFDKRKKAHKYIIRGTECAQIWRKTKRGEDFVGVWLGEE
tara:strand:+ start:178 stop:528 length:351 start_codon:yes stop_codon:yes gene_type:complete